MGDDGTGGQPLQEALQERAAAPDNSNPEKGNKLIQKVKKNYQPKKKNDPIKLNFNLVNTYKINDQLINQNKKNTTHY